MTRSLLTFALALSFSCGTTKPDVADGDTGAGTAAADSTTAAESTASTPTDVGSTGTASTDAGALDTTGGPQSACLEFSAADCPAPCVAVEAFPVASEGCGIELTDPRPLCVAAGAAVVDSQLTTVYGEIDGELLAIPVGLPGCFGANHDVLPANFDECTAGRDAPEVCTCFCGADGCPDEAERELLDGCAFATPCGEAVPHKGGFMPGRYAQCVLAALRDRTPGVYESEVDVSTTFDGSRVYVDGTEDAQFIHRRSSDLCFDPLAGTWEPNLSCTLKPAAYFEDCLAGDASHMQACLWGETWFDACVEIPAACP